MPNITIRDATEIDVAAITTIYAFYVSHSTACFEDTPPSIAEILDRLRHTTDLGFPYLVAEVDDNSDLGETDLNRRRPHVCGYAYAGPFRSRFCWRFTVENSVYVDDSYKSRGVGKMLLSSLIDRMRHCRTSSGHNGIRQMIAVIGGSDNLISVKLHDHLGFRQIGLLSNVGWKFGRWHDVVLMQLDLQK